MISVYVCYFCKKEFEVDSDSLPNPWINFSNELGLPMCNECWRIMINETF